MGNRSKELIPTNVPDIPKVEVVDWEYAFKVLCACLAREMISSASLYFVLMSVKEECGEKVARVGAEHMVLNRDKTTQDFMG